MVFFPLQHPPSNIRASLQQKLYLYLPKQSSPQNLQLRICLSCKFCGDDCFGKYKYSFCCSDARIFDGGCCNGKKTISDGSCNRVSGWVGCYHPGCRICERGSQYIYRIGRINNLQYRSTLPVIDLC